MNDRPEPPHGSRGPRGSENGDGPENEELPPKFSQRSWVWFMLVLIMAVMGYHYMSFQMGRDQVEVSFHTFVAEIESGNVSRVEQIAVEQYRAELVKGKSVQPALPPDAPAKDAKRLTANIPEPLTEKLEVTIQDYNVRAEQANAEEVELVFMQKQSPMLGWVLLNILPFLLIIGIFWYMTSRVRRQMGPGLFGRFTGNRAKRYERGKDSVTFADVAGLRNVKTELQEVVDFLKSPERFARIGAKIPKGVLLVGPPGTGKTLLARAVAGEAGVPFFSISGSEFIELFVGVGASRVRELFDEAKKNSPCIIFIDEIDAVGRSRGTGLGGGHDEREQTLNQILSEMDGFESNQAVIVLAATNRPDVLDQALVRPGRFDRQVVVERPQRDGRMAILKVHTRKIPLSKDVDLASLARGTIGFSGADLQNLANESALLAAREGKSEVSMEHFERAKDKILLGTLRDEAMTDEEKRVTAYHEAGHAVIAMMLPEADPVHSVTIVPRGRALGVTQMLPKEDAHNLSRQYLLSQVAIALGGRAAEELIFNEVTTGAENDLDRATDLVEKMICRWGMSEKLGPVSLRRSSEHVFLGRELGESNSFSEHTAMLIDQEIREFLESAHRKAHEILLREKDRLVKLAEELLEREVLNDAEIYDLLDLPMPKAILEVASTKSEPTPPPSSPSPTESPVEDIDPELLGGLGSA